MSLQYVAALQHLPPRARAVLFLWDVLKWEPGEVAELFDMSVDAVNGTVERARTTLEIVRAGAADSWPVSGEEGERLLRFAEAFERTGHDAT